MKNKYFIFFLILAGITIIGSCKEDFLTVKPAGSLDEGRITVPAAGDQRPQTGYMALSEVWKPTRVLTQVTSLLSTLFRHSVNHPQTII
jgi:hypothetical protein